MRISLTTLTIFLAILGPSFANDDDDKTDDDNTVYPTEDLPLFPTTRFTAWDELPHEVRDNARKAGYHEKFWNKPGTADWEGLDYESLQEDMVGFVDSIGMTQEQWDCHINHYRNYRWGELKSHKRAYVTLGWTHAGWAHDGTTTEIEGKYWEDLTQDQQDAAASLCYTEQLWDEVEIPLWSEDDGSGGETGEKDDKNLYSKKESQVADQKQDLYENLYDANDRDKGDFEGPASAHNDRGVEIPFFRYQPWDLLSSDYKKLAETATYDEKTWNAIGSHKLEKMDFGAIGKENHAIQVALKKMGFNAKSWDCYMSHYASFEWGELEKVGVQSYFQQLGWDHRSWDQDQKPETDGQYWPDLTPEQQNAAYQVGYFREVWDEVSLQFWPRTTSNTYSLKKYAKKHPAAAGGGAFITITVLIGLIFCCGYCCRKNRRSGSIEKDLEMYGDNGLAAFPQSYKDEIENVQYDDGYDDEEEEDNQNNPRIV